MDFDISNLENLEIEELTNELYPHLELFNDLIKDEDYETAQTLLQSNDELCQYIILLYAVSISSKESDCPFFPTIQGKYVKNFTMIDDFDNIYTISISNNQFIITENIPK